MNIAHRMASLPQNRITLAKVLSSAKDVITIDDVMKALGNSRHEAAKRLSRWVEQGWLYRVGRGTYVPVALDTMGAEQALDDPWVLIPPLYEPAYVAGRTAAEHWDLTEQIFKDIVVVTGRAVRQKNQIRHGTRVHLKHIDAKKIFGTKSVWRHRTKVAVSDVHRTMVDMLDDPAFGGGIQHVSDCLTSYLKRSDRDDQKLIEYADRLGNGAVFKRLGFLLERQKDGTQLANLCQIRLSTGLAKLDPALPTQRVNSKWKLRLPETWARSPQVD
jgi:predicted transcriptional regulator of viral defense system